MRIFDCQAQFLLAPARYQDQKSEALLTRPIPFVVSRIRGLPMKLLLLFLIVGAVLLIDYFAEPALDPVNEVASPS